MASGQLEILPDDVENKITEARANLIEAEAKLIQVKFAASLAKIKFNKFVLMMQDSKEAVSRSREILDNLKDI
jgi:hypothetical protein